MRNLYTIIITAFIIHGTYAQDKPLFVTTLYGGPANRGAFFTADSNGSNFHVVYYCDSTGSAPVGDMLEAGNGRIYGVTATGGCADSCVIYEYEPSTGKFLDIHDFGCNVDSGESAQSGLIAGADGNLYGTAAIGGLGSGGGNGVIYSVSVSDNSYHVVYFFNDSSGSAPRAPLLQLSDGKFYGTAPNGGEYISGVIFRFDPVTSVYSILHHFNSFTGASPYYGGLIQAGDGKLYGTTYEGGLYNAGVIFSLDLSGNIYSVLHDFEGTDGGQPYSGLLQGTDGKLYGTTFWGGLYNYGTLFSFDPLTDSFNILHNFNYSDGQGPERSLIQTSSGKLFGTTSAGGNSNAGVVFSFDIGNNTFAKVYEFDGVTGKQPAGGVFEYSPKAFSTIADISKTSSFTLSPNPATSSVSISVSEDLIGANATLSDVTGRKITAVQLLTTHHSLITTDLESGVYFITVSTSDGQRVSKKLVIEK